VKVFIRLS